MSEDTARAIIGITDSGRPYVAVPAQMLERIGVAAGPGIEITADADRGQVSLARAKHPHVELSDDMLAHLCWDEGTEVLIRLVGGEIILEQAAS